MTNAEFTAWRQHMGLNRREASEALGLSINSITAYERDGAKIPRYVALACTAVTMRLQPWPYPTGG